MPYIQDLTARQRNVTRPDALRGGRSVDEFLFKGNRKAPIVQRVAAVVLAAACAFIGLAFVDLYLDQKHLFEAVFACFPFLAAAWLLRIGFIR